MNDLLLRISDLHVEFPTDEGVVRAVAGVSYELRGGETLAVVGESGCGKSVAAMSILGLIESQRGRITSGVIEFCGTNLLELDPESMRRIRGNRIAMIFQEPMTSLNPVYTIGDQIGEVLRTHRGLDGPRARDEAVRLLEAVRMPAAAQRIDEYPHQLSGGMRQRVMIAMALSCRPQLLIADEPTTALDVTVQAQILELVTDLQSQLGMAVLLITHDLGVVANVAHRVVVMYAGRVVESATTEALFDAPRHPYTAGLLNSLPRLTADTPLTPIEGTVPDALRLPSGCPFHPRCPLKLDRCEHEAPELRATQSEHHTAACFYEQANPEADFEKLMRQRSADLGASDG